MFTQSEALPELKKLYNNHRSLLEIVSVSVDSKKEDWLDFTNEKSIPWSYLWDGKGEYGDAVVKYWVIGTPNYVLISPDKVILDKWFGYSEGTMTNKIDKHLRGKSNEAS